jgi:hypothetical protein
VDAYLVTGTGEHITIDADTLTIGRNADTDLPLVSDPRVSGLHAVVHRYRGGWSVQDLNSLNGTFVNGQRVVGERQLRPRDEIGVGNCRLIFRAAGGLTGPTERAGDPPDTITPTEHRVLVELCRPLVGGEPFPQPASVADIAKVLIVSEETVKWHLKNLIAKFGIEEAAGSRRIVLANVAIRCRAVNLAELQTPRS